MLPLESEPSKRSGKNPKHDTKAYPIEGKKITSQTGEVGIVRRAPDLQALKKDLQVSERMHRVPAVRPPGQDSGRRRTLVHVHAQQLCPAVMLLVIIELWAILDVMHWSVSVSVTPGTIRQKAPNLRICYQVLLQLCFLYVSQCPRASKAG